MHLITTKMTELLHRKIPILAWLPTYNTSMAVSDVLAGITVGLTLIPQAIAYASLAGLDPKVNNRKRYRYLRHFYNNCHGQNIKISIEIPQSTVCQAFFFL